MKTQFGGLRASLVLFGISLFLGCAQPDGNDRLKEKADIEAESDQNRTDQKALEMEARLARQQRFYEGVAGVYEGEWRADKQTFRVRFVLTPSIPAYTGNRIRSMDEITFDLTNLTLSVEETMTWKLKNGEEFSDGCNYSLLKPRTDSGFIQVSNSECKLTFVLSVGSAGVDKSGSVTEMREAISRKLLDGEIDRIDDFRVEKRSVYQSGSDTFNVRRTGF